MLARVPRTYGNWPGAASRSRSPDKSSASYASLRVTPAGVVLQSSSGVLPVSAKTCCRKRARTSEVMLTAALPLAQNARQRAAGDQRYLVGAPSEIKRRLLEAGDEPNQTRAIGHANDR